MEAKKKGKDTIGSRESKKNEEKEEKEEDAEERIS